MNTCIKRVRESNAVRSDRALPPPNYWDKVEGRGPGRPSLLRQESVQMRQNEGLDVFVRVFVVILPQAAMKDLGLTPWYFLNTRLK